MVELEGQEEPDLRHPDIIAIVGILRERRIQLGLTQWDLAVRTGTSQSRLSETETGQTFNPGARSLAIIARTLGMRLNVVDERMFIEEVIPTDAVIDEDL